MTGHTSDMAASIAMNLAAAPKAHHIVIAQSEETEAVIRARLDEFKAQGLIGDWESQVRFIFFPKSPEVVL
jgi:hypothetical protein